ncbi:MAG: alpha/beta hydrolase [Anaerolineaceae bacterium]|nr:alpha/beta hydrolase [Anaerolineae bacterium]MCB9458810.1 alpha/beta hydrolase [Anaerolineaceae bacterium]
MPFDQYYAGVPPEQRQALLDFRQAHPPRTVNINDTDWTFYTMGRGSKVILWLVGGLRMADAACAYIPLMEPYYRIVTVDYPRLDSMTALADGLATLLSLTGINPVNILSGSFGGMLAQVFVRRYPGYVSKLVLSSTTAPDPAQAKAQNAPLGMLGMLPGVAARMLARQQMYKIMAPPPNEAAFWQAYLAELYSERVGKPEIISTLRCVKDFNQQTFTQEDLAEWKGEILVINSSDDATFTEQGQHAMKYLYPDAFFYTLQDAGHSPASTQPENFFGTVHEFFQRP